MIQKQSEEREEEQNKLDEQKKKVRMPLLSLMQCALSQIKFFLLFSTS